MNYLDVIIIVPLIWGAYKGFKKGLVTEISTLIALLLGVYGGVKFTDYASEQLRTNFGWDTEYLPIIGFAFVFVLIVLVTYLVGKTVEKMLKLIALGLVNKLSGAIFGIIKFTLVVSVFLMLFNSLDQKINILSTKQKEESLLFKPMSDFSTVVIPAIQDSEVYQNASAAASNVSEELE